MTIAFFMILEQLQIAPEIVRIAFTAIMFALALGLALAFGLGGRDLAADLLRQARDRSSQAASQARHDVRTGTERAKDEMGQYSSSTGSTGSSGTLSDSGAGWSSTGSTSGTGATTGTTPGGSPLGPDATQHMPPPAPPNR